jgi:hypothetical protein
MAPNNPPDRPWPAPFISDERDGTPVHAAFQLSKFAGHQLPDGAGSTAPFDPFHAQRSS